MEESQDQSTPTPEQRMQGIQAEKKQQLEGYGRVLIETPHRVQVDTHGNVMTPREVAEHRANGNQDPAAR